MKLEILNDIKNYTKNLEIINMILNLNADGEGVLSLYKRIKELTQYEVPDETVDLIVRTYIKSAIATSNETFKRFIMSCESIIIHLMQKKNEVISKILLDDYISICQKLEEMQHENSDIRFVESFLINSEYINTYRFSEHINILKFIMENIENKDVLEFLKLILPEAYQYEFIVMLVKQYQSCKTIPQKFLMRKLFNGKDGVVMSSLNIEDAARIIPTLEDVEEIRMVQEALKSPECQKNADFKELYEIIQLVIINGYKVPNIYQNVELLKRSKQDILSLIEMANKNPDSESYFYDQRIIHEFSWEEQRNLFIIHDLDDDNNMKKFREIFTKLLSEGEKGDTLYSKVLEELSKRSYIITVEEYLKEVKSIEEFIKVLSENFDKNEDITPKTSIIVRK